MKLVIDLDQEWMHDDTISNAIKSAIEEEMNKEIRKLVKTVVSVNHDAIIAVANAYAKRMVTEAEKALK